MTTLPQRRTTAINPKWVAVGRLVGLYRLDRRGLCAITRGEYEWP